MRDKQTIFCLAIFMNLAFMMPDFSIGQQISTTPAQEFYNQAKASADTSKKMGLLLKAIRANPQLTDARLELTDIFDARGDFSHSLSQLDAILNYDRNNSAVWYLKGRNHSRLKEYQTAVKCFERAIQIDPDRPQYHIAQGVVLFEIIDRAKALGSFRRADSIALVTQDSIQQGNSLLWMGKTYMARGDTSEALALFQKALTVKPGLLEARRGLADIWYERAIFKIDKDSLVEGLANLEMSIAYDSSFKDAKIRHDRIAKKLRAEAIVDSAQFLRSEQRFEEAIGLLSAEIVNNPNVGIDSLIRQIQIEWNKSRTMKENTLSDGQKLTTPKRSIESKPISQPAEPNNVNLDSLNRVNGSKSAKENSERRSIMDQIAEINPFGMVSGLSMATLLVLVFFLAKRGKVWNTKNDPDDTIPATIPRSRSEFALLKIEDIVLDRYRIESQMPSGSMGHVYKAYDLKNYRPIALKVIRLEAGMGDAEIAEKADRFKQEIIRLAKLNFPNIVTLHDHEYETQGGIFYMMMEYVEGETIKELIERDKSLPLDLAIDITSQTCKALGYAHSQGLVHRDIKPSNLILSSLNVVKVIDFGIAKAMSSSQSQIQTRTGMLVGSPKYMSPEQIDAKRVDTRSDIFSLGSVFYEMLAGKSPFDIKSPDSLIQVFQAILRNEPASLTSIRPDVPEELESIIMKMLKKDPDSRYQHVDEIEFDIKRLRTN